MFDDPKLRTRQVVEILKKEAFTEDDFQFLSKFITTYFPEPAKELKAVLNKDGLAKVFKAISYKELKQDEQLFNEDNYQEYYILLFSGNIEIRTGKPDDEKFDVIKSFGKQSVMHPAELESLLSETETFYGKATQESILFRYEKFEFDKIILENQSNSIDSKLNGLSKAFPKIKKMERANKEETLSFFKTEKFSKGTIIITPTGKIEEMYIIESGKVVLCQKNDKINPDYSRSFLMFACLQAEDCFNEYPLFLDKKSPYFAVCVEDVEALALDKDNLQNVADADTLASVRANSQGKQRLQSLFIDRIAKLSKEKAEENQQKFCTKFQVKMQDVEKVFEKYDPKSKGSVQYLKNLALFEQKMGKPATKRPTSFNEPEKKELDTGLFTPKLASKNDQFKNMDLNRQRALLSLRAQGQSLRSGNFEQKDMKTMNQKDFIGIQSRLLKEEREQMESISAKKSISERTNINQTEEKKAETPKEKEKPSEESSGDSTKNAAAGGGFMGKMKALDNQKLLANFGFLQDKPSDNNKKEEPPKSNNDDSAKKSMGGVMFQKPKQDADEAGLGFVKKSAGGILGKGKRLPI